MPKVTVYIRNEDIDKWKAIKQKTEFIHTAIHNSGFVNQVAPSDIYKPKSDYSVMEQVADEPIKYLGDNI